MGTYVFMSNNKVFATMERFDPAEEALYTAAFASGVQGKIITEFPTAQVGDVWDGSKFIETSPRTAPEEGVRVALMVETEIVEIEELQPTYPYYEKWMAGFSGEHVGFDATGYPNVRSGSTWDGQSFHAPEPVNG
jgi:hypothetical protein